MRFELHTGIVIGLALSAYLLGALLGAWAMTNKQERKTGADPVARESSQV